MSDDAAPPEPAKPSEPAKPEPRPRKRRRWLRRLAWTLGILLTLLLIFRIVLIIALPTVINRVGNYYGVDVSYSRLQLSVLGGQAALWDVSVTLKSTGQEVLRAEYLNGNLSVWELFQGRLHLWRAEVDGTLLTVVREADGSIPLIQTLLDGLPKSTTPSSDLNLTSPLQVDALRLHKIDLHFQDKSVTPAIDAVIRTSIRVSNVAALNRRTNFEIDIAAQPMVDFLHIEGEGTAGGPELDARVKVILRGLHPAAAAGYLRLLGLEPQAYDISGQVSGHVSLRAVNPATMPSTRPALGGDKSAYITGKLLLDDALLSADGEPALVCRKLSIDVDRLNLAAAEIPRVNIDGVELHARRTSDARLQFAGLQLGATVNPATRPVVRSPATAAVATGAAPFRWSVGELTIGNVQANLVDDVVRPSAQLAFGVRQLRISNIIGDPDQPDAALDLSGNFELPHLARSVTLAGSARPFAPRKTAELAVELGGLKPDAVRPYLDVLGLESRFNDGSFSCKLNAGLNIDPDGRVHADLGLSGLSLKDGPELLKFDDVTLSGLSLAPDLTSIDIRSIELTGPTIVGSRDKDGRLELVGLRTAPIEELLHRFTREAPAPDPSTQPFLPMVQALGRIPLERVSIGKVTWHKVSAVIDDRMAQPPVQFQLREFSLNAANLNLDLTGKKPASTPGAFDFRFSMPGVARSLTATGSLLPQANAVVFKVFVDGQGLSPELLAPYIKPTGIEPVLRDGSLTLQAQGTLARAGDRLETVLTVEKLKYADGATELAAVDRLDIDRLILDGKTISAEKIEVTGPRASVTREPDGSLLAGGIRLRVPAPPKGLATAVGDSKQPAATRPATRPTQPLLPTLPIELALKQLRIKDAALAWNDQAVSPAVQTTAGVSLDLDNFTYGGKPAPARVALQLKASGALDLLDVKGDVTLSPSAQAAKLDVTATGLRAGPLRSYLPPGIDVTLKDGRLKTSIDAALSIHPQGGYAGHVLVNGADFGDGQASLLKLDGFRVVVDRADLPDTLLAVKELTAKGVETDLELTRESALKLLGVVLSEAPAPARPAPAAPAPVRPVAEAAPAAAPAAPNVQDAAMLAGRARKPLPQVTVDLIDLQLKRATFTNSLRPGTAPITLADFRFRNLNRVDALGADAAEKPEASFELTGRIDPLVQQFKLRTDFRPFADEPLIKLNLAANGIQGDGIAALVPEIKPHVDTSTLRDGQFKTEAVIHLVLDRRTGLGLDLSRGFGMDLTVRDTEFRAAPDGPVLAGLESLTLTRAQVRPAQPAFIARSLELTKPMAAIHRDKTGIHALGVVIKVPGLDPATQPAAAPAAPPPVAPAPAVAAVPATQPARPQAEIRLDRLIINGLDVAIEDRTFEPPVLVPLKGMDLEARDLSNLMFFEDRPVRFSLLVNSGKVPLPRRRASKSNVEAASQKDQTLADFTLDPSMEMRELFSQVAASGRLSLYPTLNGYAKGSASGFEILALRGIANAADIKIGGGTFDGKVDAVFPGDGSLELRLRAEVTQLRVREPKGGAIEKTLQLPAPLDIVIVGLEGPDDSIVLRLPVKVEKGNLNKSQVTGAAIGAFAGVAAEAIAAAPLKVLKVGGSLVGLDLGKKQQLQPVSIAFPPGYTGVERPLPPTWAALLKGMKDEKEVTVTLRHDLGEADVQRVSELVNPGSPTEAMHLRDLIKRKRLDLFVLRADVAGQARAQLAAGLGEQAELTLQRLRGLEAEIAATDNALDQVYEMLRDGGIPAPLRDRRARAASLTLGQERLGAVWQMLVSEGIDPRRINVIAQTFNPRAEPGAITLSPVQKKKQ